jgi:membrane protease YdiL (CAAX protease family)
LEELFYRGALFTRISRAAGVGFAGFVSCVGFVFAHSELRDWLALLLVGVALTWLRIKARSIWPSVACHMAFNLTTLVAMLADVSDFSGSLWLVMGAVVFSFALLAAVARTTGSAR